VAAIYIVFSLPDKATAAPVYDVECPLWDWQDSEEMDR
jgi:hypothetical protein